MNFLFLLVSVFRLTSFPLPSFSGLSWQETDGLYRKNAKLNIYHVQNLTFKSKYCLISCRFAPINTRKNQVYRDACSNRWHWSNKTTKRCHQKHVYPKKFWKTNKFCCCLALKLNDRLHFWKQRFASTNMYEVHSNICWVLDVAAGISQTRMEAATTKAVRKTAFQSGVLRYRLAT